MKSRVNIYRLAGSFKNSFAARPSGRCFGQKATIFLSGRGDCSERYSGKSSRSLRAAIAGINESPRPEHTSAWIVSLRTFNRRFVRKTINFSKKVENLEHAVSLHFMHYNFARIHKTLRVTPSMEAGIADHVWSLEETAALAA